MQELTAKTLHKSNFDQDLPAFLIHHYFLGHYIDSKRVSQGFRGKVSMNKILSIIPCHAE